MADPCGDNWTSLVTWVLVFVGWFAVHKTTLSRERRKEKREVAWQICIEFRTTERSAIDFHTAQSHDNRKATDLRQDIERLIRRLQRAPLSELDIPFRCMIRFRQSITRQNVDPSDFAAQATDSDLVQNIRDTTTDLIEAIENRRNHCWV